MGDRDRRGTDAIEAEAAARLKRVLDLRHEVARLGLRLGAAFLSDAARGIVPAGSSPGWEDPDRLDIE